MNYPTQQKQLPEIYQIEALQEIENFRDVIFNRLLPAFSTINHEAEIKSETYLKNKSANFNPEIDDEASIYEAAYFENITHVLTHEALKEDFLKISAVWLFHIFERRFQLVFKPRKKQQVDSSDLSAKSFKCKGLFKFNKRTFPLFIKKHKKQQENFKNIAKQAPYLHPEYNIDTCPNFKRINRELRGLANAIKHGLESRAFEALEKKYPHYIEDNKIQVTENDINQFIESIDFFWKNSINITK